MRIAILQYHLQPAGVTTVIRNAQRALADDHEIKVIADGGYNQKPARSRAAFLRDARRLMTRLASRLKGVDVLHTHNIGLGKNPRLTFAVKLLAESNSIKLLNQVHDFPEDNRPVELRALRMCTGRRDDEFFRSMAYYDRPNVRWATLTTADASKLAQRGIPRTKIDVLANPIDDAFFTQPAPDAKTLEKLRSRLADYARTQRYIYHPNRRLLLSPMKVMQRKNNSEAVDLLQQLGDRYQLLITLDATASADKKYSAALKRRIRRERLPVVIGFGYELKNPLPLFHLAHAILTTSQVEGFGYTFVEGWLCNKLVVGRDLENVTEDFTRAGLDLRHLYRALDRSALKKTRQLLDRPPRKLIEHNRRVVLRQYSLAAYAKRFEKIVGKFRRK